MPSGPLPATAEEARRGKLAIAVPPAGIVEGACFVIDGDTIRIGQTKIRLAGIDAPELDMPWGQKAKWAMVGLCKGHKIRAECTGEQSHDRLVATCYLPDGRDLGAELVKQGLALDYPLFSGGKYKRYEVRGARRKLKWVYTAEQRAEAHRLPKAPEQPARSQRRHAARSEHFAAGPKTPSPRT